MRDDLRMLALTAIILLVMYTIGEGIVEFVRAIVSG